VTVTDGNGCEVTNEVIITEPEALSLTGTTSTSTTCYGGNDGTITAGDIVGGVPPFEYSINNNDFQDSKVFNNLPSDSYTIFIRDANDCALQDFVSVEQPDELSADISKINIDCKGDNTGEISFSNIVGGSGQYEFKIEGPDSRDWTETTSFSDLLAGDYSIYIRDLNNKNCEINLNSNLNLSEPANTLTATYTATRTTRFGSPTGTATVNAAGGTSGYFYEWRKVGDESFLQNTQTATDLLAGDYTVMVRDSKGCTLSEPIPVEIIDNVDAQIIKTTRCLDSDDRLRTSTFQVDIDLIQGGVGDPSTDFQYYWEFGQNAQPANSGSYSNNYQQIHTVNYTAKGDKVITLWIKDGSGFESSYTFDQFVGECFSGCDGGSSQDFTIDEDNYFIGDKDGNKLTNTNCLTATEKYLYIDITKASNAHTLDVEMIYHTTLNENTIVPGRLLRCFGTVIGS
ncbi:MAG TPA: SprB repeat-containing protein, partial [Christiangramia sp.]|nr:SprB repeat-containing protein [Christiangramia sp.]